MPRTLEIAGHAVGEGHPTYVIAEIGVNHNGSLDIAKRLIAMAKAVGCDAVKFQKRNPEKCVPVEQRDQMRETPWGYITYMEYRHKVEFGENDFRQIDQYCREHDIAWFASCWDIETWLSSSGHSGRRASRFLRRALQIASFLSIARASGCQRSCRLECRPSIKSTRLCGFSAPIASCLPIARAPTHA